MSQTMMIFGVEPSRTALPIAASLSSSSYVSESGFGQTAVNQQTAAEAAVANALAIAISNNSLAENSQSNLRQIENPNSSSSSQVTEFNVILTIVYLSIFIIGVVGNLCNCLVIADSRSKYMKTATNYYLFSLSVSDLLLLIFGLPHDIVTLWYPSYLFSEFVCVTRGWISEASTYASVLVIVAFTVERYLAICHPLKAHTLSRLSRSVKIIIIIWIVASSCALVVVRMYKIILTTATQSSRQNNSSSINQGQEQQNVTLIRLCTTDDEKAKIIFDLSVVIFFMIPMTLITILYVKLGCQLRQQSKFTIRQSEIRKQQQSLHQQLLVTSAAPNQLTFESQLPRNEELRQIQDEHANLLCHQQQDSGSNSKHLKNHRMPLVCGSSNNSVASGGVGCGCSEAGATITTTEENSSTDKNRATTCTPANTENSGLINSLSSRADCCGGGVCRDPPSLATNPAATSNELTVSWPREATAAQTKLGTAAIQPSWIGDNGNGGEPLSSSVALMQPSAAGEQTNSQRGQQLAIVGGSKVATNDTQVYESSYQSHTTPTGAEKASTIIVAIETTTIGRPAADCANYADIQHQPELIESCSNNSDSSHDKSQPEQATGQIEVAQAACHALADKESTPLSRASKPHLMASIATVTSSMATFVTGSVTAAVPRCFTPSSPNPNKAGQQRCKLEDEELDHTHEEVGLNTWLAAPASNSNEPTGATAGTANKPVGAVDCNGPGWLTANDKNQQQRELPVASGNKLSDSSTAGALGSGFHVNDQAPSISSHSSALLESRFCRTNREEQANKPLPNETSRASGSQQARAAAAACISAGSVKAQASFRASHRGNLALCRSVTSADYAHPQAQQQPQQAAPWLLGQQAPIALNSSGNTANVQSVIKMLVSVVVMFFICWAPFHAQRLMAVYVTDPTPQLEFGYNLLNHVSGVSYYISAVVNPILYSLREKTLEHIRRERGRPNEPCAFSSDLPARTENNQSEWNKSCSSWRWSSTN